MKDQQQTLLTEERTLTPAEMMPDSISGAHDEIVPVSRELTPMEILQSAVDKGVDAEQLEKLLELQERYEANQARKAFSESMHAAQTEMPRVIRDADNKQTGSKYARLEDVQIAAGPIYTKHGFSLSYGEGATLIEGYKRTICDVRHSAGHVEQYHLDLPIDGIGPRGNAIGGMNRVQGCISTTSYGQRRLLCMIFNITIAGDDNDGQYRPPEHDTPNADPNAPRTAPRGARDPISPAQWNEIKTHWESQNPRGTRTDFNNWFQDTTGNEFTAPKNVTIADYDKCCKALGVPE